MRIAQVVHLTESVPPKRYGGTERIVAYLTDELVQLGHDVTLFASGDSTTCAQLEAVYPDALRGSDQFVHNARLTVLLERVFGVAEDFDIIHSHLDFCSFPLVRRCSIPVLTTVHGTIGLPELMKVYREFSEIPLVAVSEAQRKPCPWANWKATIPHGLPQDLYRFHPEPGAYLAFLGRISAEEGTEEAIAVARCAGIPLKMAAKVDPVDHEYFQAVVKPLLEDGRVDFIGEITDEGKNAFLGQALALVCPFRPESFGLVLVESLACGTPVLAYRHGSFPEIIDHGITGFLCRTAEEMAESVSLLPRLDRRRCRAAFEARFTASRMVFAYLEVYDELILARRAQRDRTALH